MKDCGAGKVKPNACLPGPVLFASDELMHELKSSANTGAVSRLAPGLHRIVAPNPSPLTGPGTNTYVVGAGHEHLVIDPGPGDSVHIERILQLTNGRIDGILCSHSHPDHSPGAVVLKRLTGAPVLGRAAPDDGLQDETYAPDDSIEDGQVFEATDLRLRAVHTPGHASNHVCFLLEPAGWLLTGDHLMSGSTVVILPPDGSMRLYLESLDRLRALPLNALLPGHGAAILDPLAEINRVVTHRLRREAKVIAALQCRPARRATLDALLPQVYDDTPLALHPLARFSLLAHLQKLVEEARVSSEGDTWAWTKE